MNNYRDDAIVLRTYKLAEADRIVHLLSRNHGKIKAVAKGVRRTKSRFGGRLEPFMQIDIQLYHGRNLDTVTQVETISAFAGPIVADYRKYTMGSTMLEAAEKILVTEAEPAVQQYWLLAGGLNALATEKYPASLVLDSYLVRALAVAGWAPSLSICARCAVPGPHQYFSVPSGGMVCGLCRIPGSVKVSPDALHLLTALLTGDWQLALTIPEKFHSEVSGVVAAYSQYYLERELKSLPHIDRSGPDRSVDEEDK